MLSGSDEPVDSYIHTADKLSANCMSHWRKPFRELLDTAILPAPDSGDWDIGPLHDVYDLKLLIEHYRMEEDKTSTVEHLNMYNGSRGEMR
jgi:hypothetical protein